MSASFQVSIIAKVQKTVNIEGVIHVIVQSGTMGTKQKMVKAVLQIPYHYLRLS